MKRKKSKKLKLKKIAIGKWEVILLLVTLCIVGVLFWKFPGYTKIKEPQPLPSITPTATEAPSPTSTPYPTPMPTFPPLSLDSIDWDISHWKTYTGRNVDGKNVSYTFSIKYPPNWNFVLRDNSIGVYYPFGLASDKDFFETPRILLGTGGHGGPPSGYGPRTFQSGQAYYGWNVDAQNRVYAVARFTSDDTPYTKQYLFEIDLVPVKNAEEEEKLKKIFDMMLDTFQPLN